MKAQPLVLLFLFLCFSGIIELNAQEVFQWRGDDRTGVYKETGLLKQWPETGPSLLWEYNAIGNGYGSPIITSDRIFINGEKDSVCYLFAMDLTGKLIWKSKIGEEWMANYS